MVKQITDMETWLLDNGDRLFRYRVYRRMFTPYEQDKKYMDQSDFESDYRQFGYIEEAIDLGDGEWYLGIREVFDDLVMDFLTYYYLSELRLEYSPSDQGDFESEICEES